MSRVRHHLSWLLWAAASLAASVALAQALVGEESSRAIFLPGETTAGHYQIELACGACHSSGFADDGEIQAACVTCHGEELEEAKDAHPMSKFKDPRNASRVEVLDARRCATCHAEHLPEQTTTMGLSIPKDYCYHCHQDILAERASHRGLSFDSCGSAGCHNFHDNRALYEDFLVEHGRDPWLSVRPTVPRLPGRSETGVAPLAASAADLRGGENVVGRWAASVHAAQGVNCSGCHVGSAAGAVANSAAVAHVGPEGCSDCHQGAVSGWLAGRHGMRLGADLSPMTPGAARAKMRTEVAHEALTCASCHGDHGTERETAGFEACVRCHDDEHSRAYEGSAHHELLLLERDSRIARGGGVSCATCHLPVSRAGDGTVSVLHNQNANLRPNEKMIRSVCQNCHGVPFALDALADASLVEKNFTGRPSRHVESVDWALAREP